MPSEFRGLSYVGLIGNTYNSVTNPSSMLDTNETTYATYIQTFNGTKHTSYSYLVFSIPEGIRFYGVKVKVGVEKIVTPSSTSTSGNPIPFHLCVAFFGDQPYVTSDSRDSSTYTRGISKREGIASNFTATATIGGFYPYQTYTLKILPTSPSRVLPPEDYVDSVTPEIVSNVSVEIPYISSVPGGVYVTCEHTQMSFKPSTNTFETDWSDLYVPENDGRYKGLFPPTGVRYMIVGIIPQTLYGSQLNTVYIHLRVFDLHLIVPSNKGDWYVYDTSTNELVYREEFTDGNLGNFVPSLGETRKIVGFFPSLTYINKIHLRVKTTTSGGHTTLKFWGDINLNFDDPGTPISTLEVFGSTPKTLEVPINQVLDTVHIGS